MSKLTELEIEIMKAIPNDNFYEEGLDSVLWVDCFLDNIKMDNKQARGVLSSLKQKELLSIDGGHKDATIRLTESGKIYMEKHILNNEGDESMFKREDLEILNRDQVRKIAAGLRIKNYSKYTKEQLINVIIAQTPEIPDVVGELTDTKSEAERLVNHLTETSKSKSEIIRTLLAEGWTRSAVAKALGIKYQMVREVEMRQKMQILMKGGK